MRLMISQRNKSLSGKAVARINRNECPANEGHLYHRPDKYTKIVMKEGFIPNFSYITRAFYNSLMTLSDKYGG